jgi:hypothetical protein
VGLWAPAKRRSPNHLSSFFLQTLQVPPDLQCLQLLQLLQAVQVPVGEHLAFWGSQQPDSELERCVAKAPAPTKPAAKNKRRGFFMSIALYEIEPCGSRRGDLSRSQETGLR